MGSTRAGHAVLLELYGMLVRVLDLSGQGSTAMIGLYPMLLRAPWLCAARAHGALSCLPRAARAGMQDRRWYAGRARCARVAGLQAKNSRRW